MENNTQSKNDLINIDFYIRLYLKKWYVFIIVGLICLAISLIYIKLTDPVYLVTANILVQEDESSKGMGGVQAAMMRNFSFSSLIGTSTTINDELEIIGSFSMLRDVVKQKNLNERYYIKSFLNTKECYNNSPIKITPMENIADTLALTLKFKIKIEPDGKLKSAKVYKGFSKKAESKSPHFPLLLNTEYGQFKIDTTNFYKPGKAISIDARYQGFDYATELLQENVLIDLASKKANIINIQLPETNRLKGKDIVNSLITLYNESDVNRKTVFTQSMVSFLDERIELISDELTQIEKEIEEYKTEHSLTNIEVEAQIILTKSSDFKERMIEAEAQFTVIEMVESFLLLPDNRYALVPLNIGLSDRTVLEGLQKYNDALLERMKLMKTTMTTNPMIEVMNEQIDAMRNNMLATIKSIKSGFERSKQDLKEQENYFMSRIKGMPTQEREFIALKRQQLIKQELFVFLLQQKEENLLSMSVSTPKAQVIDQAYNLRKPIKPRPMRILAFACAVAIFISLSFIHIKHYLKP